MGSVFQYLFDTLDDNEQVEIQKILDINAHSSLKLHELNYAILLVSDGMQQTRNYESNNSIITVLLFE